MPFYWPHNLSPPVSDIEDRFEEIWRGLDLDKFRGLSILKAWEQANSNQEIQTMWYEQDKKDELDYSKPIAAFRNETEYLLIPKTAKESYKVIGYDWFCVRTGVYNSSCCFSTAKEACANYVQGGYIVENVYIGLGRDLK